MRWMWETTRHFFPLTGGCSEGLGAFWFFFKQQHIPSTISVRIMNTAQHYNTLEKSYLDIKARVASLFQEKYKYMQTFWESTQPRGGGLSKRLKWKVSGAGRVWYGRSGADCARGWWMQAVLTGDTRGTLFYYHLSVPYIMGILS